MDRKDTEDQVIDYIVATFGVARDSVTLDSNLMENLNLDSIDAVDLMVKVQELTGKKVSPDQFESVRTVRDVLNLVAPIDART